MPFCSYFWGMIVCTTVLLAEVSVSAQTMTDFALWKEVQNAEAVPNWTGQMLRRFRDVTGTARDELLAQTLSALKDIVSDSNVVPSTRYNAILAAGQLVSKEPSPGNPPVAYPAALTYLIEVYQKTNTPHYLKYGALLGIVRHTHTGIDPDHQNNVIDLLLETVTTEFKPGEVTLDSLPLEPAAWDWFRQTALDGLAALKTVGTNNKIVTELLAVINHQSQELEELLDSQSMFTRKEWVQSRRVTELASKAAKTLGDLNYTSVTNIDAKKMTDTFVRLTKSVCDVELKMIADSIEQGGTSPAPAVLLERIVVNVKMCTQSVVWGIRGGFLTAGKPEEYSFYASLESDDPTVRRLDILLAAIIELATFFDEGNPPRRSVLSANVQREFQFSLSELQDALTKISDALTRQTVM